MAAECGLKGYAAPQRLRTLRALDLFSPVFPYHYTLQSSSSSSSSSAASDAKSRAHSFDSVFTGDIKQARVHIVSMGVISFRARLAVRTLPLVQLMSAHSQGICSYLEETVKTKLGSRFTSFVAFRPTGWAGNAVSFVAAHLIDL